MSYTEIYAFDKNGDAFRFAEIRNSWRGIIAIWRILEEKYLPKYRPPNIPDDIVDVESYCKYKPTRVHASDDREKLLQEIWDLFYDKNVSDIDKIVLGTTFDNVVVKKEYLEKVINAFDSFDGETSLKEQSEFLKRAFKDDNIISIAWNQTSINANEWLMPICVEEGEHEDWYEDNADDDGLCLVYVPYNLNECSEHWYLFEN